MNTNETMAMKLNILVLVIGLAIGYALYKASASPVSLESEPAPLGREIRSKEVLKELELIQAYKNDFKGQVSPEEYRKELLSRIHRFERNRGLRVLKSTIFSEGDILLNEF